MPDLDLAKAIEAGARVLTGQVLVSEYDDLDQQTRHAFDCDTERIIWAALPHILDALAEQAAAEERAGYDCEEDRYTSRKAKRAASARAWLHDKEAEVRQ